MPDFIKALCLLSVFFVSNAAIAASAALPKSIQLTYDVTKNGQPFATVKEQFEVSGNTYKIESITKGVGVYALFGERKLTSAGDVTAEGLKPRHFELHQGDNEKKALFADFEWEKNNLHMLVKGRAVDVQLMTGAQDLASYAYQFMFNPAPIKGAFEVVLTTGKKLNRYTYDVSSPLPLEIAGKQTQTVHLVPTTSNQSKPSSETKELWLAAEYHYLPVRILLVDDNGQKLEQTLTEFNAN